MPGWDWNFVGEVFVGVAGGLIVGSYVAVGFLRGLAYEVLSHPTARKIAESAGKIGDAVGQGGGVVGLVGRIVERFLGGNGGRR